MKLKALAVTFLLFLCLPLQLPVSAADTTITPESRAEMIGRIDAIVSENLRQQRSEFSIVVVGGFIERTYKNIFGEFEPAEEYFTDVPLNKFFNSNENEYYYTIKRKHEFSSSAGDVEMLTGNLKSITLKYFIVWEENYDETQEVLNYVRGINASILKSSMTGYQKIKALHDYFLDTYSYDDINFADNTPYYLVKNRKYVCENYTALFHQALREAGFQARLVLLGPGGDPSTANGDGINWNTHTWNMVQLDGKWYHIDLTWDENGKKYPKEKYRYFLKGSAFFKTEHRWDEALYPAASADYAGDTALAVSSKPTTQKSSSQTAETSITSSEESKIFSESILSSEPVSSVLSIFTSSQEAPAKKDQPGTVVIIGGIALVTASGAGVLVYFFVLKK